ncbi:hypothetical protein T492DRAFT_881970 [Pavlovales sp. CCMP2436]|nr:hypothetical protein T492DRAFT_881970 [Pavlovales sp. CCMP2436]
MTAAISVWVLLPSCRACLARWPLFASASAFHPPPIYDARGGHFAKLQHDPVVRAVARFATVYGCTQAQAENSEIFGSVLRQNPGSMRTEEALLRARAATVDVYVELDQPDGQAAVGHIVEMKTVHYGLTH